MNKLKTVRTADTNVMSKLGETAEVPEELL